uniref:Uncharacterized protein n=1 Tax=viral metagenome TaxID=1070528 RepID=A0A6M3LRP5_9ZZZZ
MFTFTIVDPAWIYAGVIGIFLSLVCNAIAAHYTQRTYQIMREALDVKILNGED